jgi:2-iminobutanoate/2-iminopropanoate deaminase
MREVISTPNAPAAIGPYSQAIRANGFLFISGQIPVDPTTQKLVEGGVAVQTEQVLRNLEAVLKAAGSSLDNVVRTGVFLKDIGEFTAMNDVYERFFPQHAPARSTVEVTRLPKDVRVEIDAIAIVG